jgi:general secretion pathway protein G
MTVNVNRFHRGARRGFTLLEVLLVIVILVTLAAVVLPNIGSRREQANIGSTKIQLKGIEDAMEFFKTDVGRYPTTEEGLGVLNSKEELQDEELAEKWHGPYSGKEDVEDFKLKDAWNNEFRYTCPGEHNTKTFDLVSDGPDGQEDTEDDIMNWEKDN